MGLHFVLIVLRQMGGMVLVEHCPFPLAVTFLFEEFGHFGQLGFGFFVLEGGPTITHIVHWLQLVLCELVFDDFDLADPGQVEEECPCCQDQGDMFPFEVLGGITQSLLIDVEERLCWQDDRHLI